MHRNDREVLAGILDLSLEEFDRLLQSANQAYEILKQYGPFYGQESIKDPTFRTTAEPVILPKSVENIVTNLGNDLLSVGKALPKLPESYKHSLGNGLDFRIPPTWRVDGILDETDHIQMNEIEGVDSASALMIVEQMAYHLQTLEQSTAAKLVAAFKNIYSSSQKGDILKIALLRKNTTTDPHLPNHKRLIAFLEEVSKGSINVDLYSEEEVRSDKGEKLKAYDAVLNETPLTLEELRQFGLKDEQMLSNGNYNAIGNKGVYALLYDASLKEFWEKEIGQSKLSHLQQILPPSEFIETEEELLEARRNGKAVKVSWAGSDTTLINRSKGVALPEGDMEQSGDTRWELLRTLISQGVRIISQEYVRPAKIPAYLRKKGTNLQRVEWYNRICMKYVCEGDPNTENIPSVFLSAIEVTLGPNIIPASRDCAFTAGTFPNL